LSAAIALPPTANPNKAIATINALGFLDDGDTTVFGDAFRRSPASVCADCSPVPLPSPDATAVTLAQSQSLYPVDPFFLPPARWLWNTYPNLGYPDFTWVGTDRIHQVLILHPVFKGLL
jgi:hypothetical protein